MTLTAWIKNAILTEINADWIPTARIGPSVARVHHVPKGKETVIITLNAREHYSVAMTIVKVDQQEWTAAQMLVRKV